MYIISKFRPMTDTVSLPFSAGVIQFLKKHCMREWLVSLDLEVVNLGKFLPWGHENKCVSSIFWLAVFLISFSRNLSTMPVGIYLLKVSNRNSRTRCEICSKWTIKTTFWCLYCWLWTYFLPCSIVFIVNFEHVIAGWEVPEPTVSNSTLLYSDTPSVLKNMSTRVAKYVYIV